MVLLLNKNTKVNPVIYIISAYAPVGIAYNISEPNICVETNNAKVPFCRPHSKAIHLSCLMPDAKILPIGKIFASGIKQLKCIALECGLQNGTLALFVSTQIFGSDILYAIPTGAYALIMYITGFTFVFLLRRSTN